MAMNHSKDMYEVRLNILRGRHDKDNGAICRKLERKIRQCEKEGK